MRNKTNRFLLFSCNHVSTPTLHPPPKTLHSKQPVPPVSRHSHARWAPPELRCLSLSPAGVTPGLRVALLEGSTGCACARPPVPGTTRWAVGLCSEAGGQGACVAAQLGFRLRLTPPPRPTPPPPSEVNLGILLPCLCYDLEDGAGAESDPAWVSFLGEGVDFSGDSGSSPRGPQLLCQPPEIRRPTLCLSFGGTKETPSRVPRSPESNEFPGRRGTFSPLYHLGNCHPTWATCALSRLSPAGFAFVTTMSTVSFLENAEG